MFRTLLVGAVTATVMATAASAAIVAPVNVFWQDINNGVAGAVPTGRDSIAGATLGVKDSVVGQDGGFLSLGLGNVAIFDFGKPFSTEGLIVEVTFGCTQTAGLCDFDESAEIYGLTSAQFDPATDLPSAVDLTTAALIATVPNGAAQGNGLTFAISGVFRYLAVLDTSRVVADRDGFDIDRIGVTPVPVPAAFGLLAGAFGLLGALRLRRRA